MGTPGGSYAYSSGLPLLTALPLPVVGCTPLPVRWPTNAAVGTISTVNTGLPLQFALPLPVVGLAPLPGRSVPARLVSTAASPGLPILSPFLEDAPVRITGQTRPQAGPWRRVDILGPALTQAVTPPEYPTGQAQLLLPRRQTPAAAVTETFWWMPAPVVDIPVGLSQVLPQAAVPIRVTETLGWMPPAAADLPMGLSRTLPRRTPTSVPWVGYTPLPLFDEPPPPGGRLLALVRPRQTPMGSAHEPLSLLLGAVVALPPGVAGLLRPGAPIRRAPGGTLTWLGYLPAPATVMPPGAVGQPRVPSPGRAAPVSPYLATYILQVPASPFTAAEMWQFQDAPTMYTFGGTDGTVWVFAAAPTMWEW